MSGPVRLGLTPLLITKQNMAGQALIGVVVPSTGTYGTVVASLSAESLITHVAIAAGSSSSNGAPLILVTVAIGASGAETPIATTYLPAAVDPSGWSAAGTLPVPMRVAAGQRVAARFSVVSGSTTATSATIFVSGVPYASLEGL